MKKTWLILVLLTAVSSVNPSPPLPESVLAGAPSAVQFDPSHYYRLTTMWQGECKSLDIVNDGQNNKPILAKTGHFSGQHWKIAPASGGHYRLTTEWQGEAKSLDIVNDGTNNRPILAATGDYSGQYWRIAPAGNGYFRLTTMWQGTGKSLDIVNDGSNNQPILATTGDFSGQYWKISRVNFIAAPPSSLRLNSFYRKYLDADGIPIISSGRVPDDALYRVRFMALHMVSRVPNVCIEMVRRGARIAVMARTEVTTDIPEHSGLSRDLNTRARGLGGWLPIPTGSCAEENVLCYADDASYRGEDIFIHEFAHSMHNLGFVFAYPGFQRELDAAYDNARRSRLWLNTYALTDAKEYCG